MKAEVSAPEDVVFTLRVPIPLNEKLVKDAGQEKRSRQAHIIYLLEKIYETAPTNGNGKKEKAK